MGAVKETIKESFETLLFRNHGGDEVIMESKSGDQGSSHAGSNEAWGTSRGGFG